MYSRCGKAVHLVVKDIWKMCLKVVSSCLLIVSIGVDVCTRWSITPFLNINLPKLIHSSLVVIVSVVCYLSPYSTKPILTTKHIRTQ